MKNYREVKIGPYSAYAIAKKNGFEGTEEEWLESLKPPAVDPTLSEEGKAADAKVTGDALATKAVIDDTTVTDSAPWSSKHIVDMLCPPISETGNPVQCYPVSGYPLGCKASWEPTQEGSGDPSPDNIRPISGRDAVKVERCGENLLNITPFTKMTRQGITYEYVANGGIHISGTATGSSDSPTFAGLHLPPGKYYGLDITGIGVAVAIVVRRNGANRWLGVKGVFEILEGDAIKYLYMVVTSGSTLDTTVYPYIVPGTTAPTTYAPYTGQTATITLPRTIYGGTVDAVTGEGQETWKLLTLDGTEHWIASNNVVEGMRSYFVPNAVDVTDTPIATSSTEVCTHYKIMVYNAGIESALLSSEPYAYIVTNRFDSVEGLKTYLATQYAAGTPVQIAYKLATPTPFTATGAQPIQALSGVNTLLTDADSVTVTGRADPIKRITDLEDAVASMTNT